MADLPVVCTLTPDAIATRKAELLPHLVRQAQSREDTGNGLRFSFPPEAWSAIAATIDAERFCCRFLRFDISIEANGAPIVVTLSGPPGTREFLDALLES